MRPLPDPMPGLCRVPSEEYRRERWANGAGWTRQIAAARDAGAGLLWRLSIAEITADGPFSSFPGFDRQQVLLSGEGFDLLAEGSPPLQALPPHGQLAYAGEAELQCRLLRGPSQAFNVFCRRDAVQARLLHRPLVGPMYFFPADRELWAVYVLAGSASACTGEAREHLDQGDTVFFGPGLGCTGAGGRVALEGGGEVLAVCLAPPAGRI